MHQARSGLLAAGNFLIDHLKMIDVWPRQDALANVGAMKMSNGGGPYNVLKDLRRLGVSYPLAALGKLGCDAFGDRIVADCEDHGIDTSRFRRTDLAPTSFTDVMTVVSTGRRTFFHNRGANATLDLPDFDLGSSHKLFYLAYLMLLDRLDLVDAQGRSGASRVLEQALAAGYRTIVDCVSVADERFRSVVLPSLPFIDVFILNEFEAEQITARRLQADSGVLLEEVEAAAAEIRSLGVRDTVVIHFPNGALALGPQGAVRQGSVQLPASEITGATGAGDAFAAGLIHAIHEERPWSEALRCAVCVAACSLRDPSPSDGVAPLDECLALGDRYGYRAL